MHNKANLFHFTLKHYHLTFEINMRMYQLNISNK